MVLNFENIDIPLMGRVTSGVKGMNLDEKDKIIFADQVLESGALTVMTKNGYLKNVPIGEFEIMSRYRKGLRVYNTDSQGQIIFGKFGVVPPTLAVKTNGKLEKISSRQIPYDSRLGKGKQCVKNQIEAVYEFKV